eukprot:915271-Amphidinium_carterae.1
MCWAAMTHQGCPQTAQTCPRSHALYKGKLADLHWTVQAQLLRRGGLKSGKRVNPQDVDGRIQQLRSAAKAEEAAKRTDGGDRRGGSGEWERGWRPTLTLAESELREVLNGADYTWLENVHGRGRLSNSVVEFVETPPLPPPLHAGALSTHLESYLRSACRDRNLQDALQLASSEGSPSLAQEATHVHNKICARAGGDVCELRADVSPTSWPSDGSPGQGQLQLGSEVWPTHDYGDRISMDEELAALLQLPEPVPERRQCMFKALAAAWMWQANGTVPALVEVEPLAQ